MALDKSLARAVSQRNLAYWIAAGESFETALKNVLVQTHNEIRTGRPPIKALKGAIARLTRLLEITGLPGEIRESGNRRHEATICVPEAVGDTLVFVLLSGSINRNGVINLTRRRVLTASKHVIERLHLRLGTTDPLIVLNEVYSCLVASVAMDEAARVAGAQHWPLVTTNGLFVSAPGEGDEPTVLVTWMRLDQLGRKWGSVADDLRAANSAMSGLLVDRDFCVELLRLHSWLLRPHAPGPDLETMWWASRPVNAVDDAREFEESLAEQDVNHLPVPEHQTDSALATSEAGNRGVQNGGEAIQRHSVKIREQFTGIVVQVRSTGTRIVSLRNGFFGMLWQRDRVAGDTEHDALATLQLGARVTVEAFRLEGDFYSGPHSILLQQSDVADAKWSAILARYTVGSTVNGTIVWQGGGASVVVMPDGTAGWLPATGVSWFQADRSAQARLVVGQQMQFQVVGFSQQRRRLRLCLPLPEKHAVDIEGIAALYPVGALVEGTIVGPVAKGTDVVTADGYSGCLPDAELGWLSGDKSLRESLVVGQSVLLRVFGHDPERKQIHLSLRRVEGHPLERLEESAFVGTRHTGVVSHIAHYGVFVRLPMGFDGLLHRSDFPSDLSASDGDVLEVRVKSLDKQLRRVGLRLLDATDLVASEQCRVGGHVIERREVEVVTT